MEHNTDVIKNILSHISQLSEKDNIYLYNSLKTEMPTISSLSDFSYKLMRPFKKLLKGFISENIKRGYDMQFYLIEYDFIEYHYRHIIQKIEGGCCCADKSHKIMIELYTFLKKGIEIDFTAQDYNMPKAVFSTHNEIIDFFKALQVLHLGNGARYVELYTNYMKKPKIDDLTM